MKRYQRKFKEEDIKLNPELDKKITDFIREHPYKSDDEFHAFADSLGIEHSELEAQAYAILANILTSGKSKGVMPVDADPKEIEMGLKVESEHSDLPCIQRKVVADHLTENPKYYSQGRDSGLFDELK